MQGLDLNQGPSGYEPDELPDCSTLQHFFKLTVALVSSGEVTDHLKSTALVNAFEELSEVIFRNPKEPRHAFQRYTSQHLSNPPLGVSYRPHNLPHFKPLESLQQRHQAFIPLRLA